MTPIFKPPKTIDEYVRTFPPEVQENLQKLRKLIHEIVPEAKEAMAYGIPTFTLDGNLVHFAAFEHHIGFYPTPSGILPCIPLLLSSNQSRKRSR